MIAQSFLKSRRSRTLAENLSFHQKHTDLGYAGEQFAIELFKANGFHAFKTCEKENGDLTVICRKSGHYRRIEVKAATRSTKDKNSWQFCINKAQKTSCSFSDFCLLICVEKEAIFCYLVPCPVLHGLACCKISSHPTKYRGKLAPYILRDVIDFENSYLIYALSNADNHAKN